MMWVSLACRSPAPLLLLLLLLLRFHDCNAIDDIPLNPDETGAAWPALTHDDEYVDRGSVETVGGDLPVYRVGTGNHRCIIWNPDIFGFDSGITRQLADRLSSGLNATVVVPDYFRGDYRGPQEPGFRNYLRDMSDWDGQLKGDWEDKVRPYAEGHGCKVYGAHGTCWGTYMVMKLNSLPRFVVGVNAHPTHPLVMQLRGESEEEAYWDIKPSPQLFLPAGGDPDSVKPGGLACRVLGGPEGGNRAVEFPDMRHGWTVRGDMSDPAVAAEIARAYGLTFEHFRRFLR